MERTLRRSSQPPPKLKPSPSAPIAVHDRSIGQKGSISARALLVSGSPNEVSKPKT